MQAQRVRIVLALALLLAPAAARADVFVTPFAGVTFAGPGSATGAFGASVGFMSAGVFGAEAEVAYSPSFFDTSEFEFVDSDNVVTVMANLLLGVPAGGTEGPGVRPYGTVGVGLLRTNVTSGTALFDDISNTDFGMNAGVGLMGFFNDHVGLRADVRYFRALTDPEEDNEFDIDFGDFDFWRGTVGVALRF
jgi:opacity protein-like surface antigen